MGSNAAGAWAEDRTPELSPEAVLPEFLGQDLPRHLALFYHSVEAQLATCAAFAKRELDDGRRVLYLYDENDPTEIAAALRMIDIDVERRRDAGDLLIEDASEVYLDEGFDPDRMIDSLQAATRDAVADGYGGLAVAGENTWCFHTDSSFDHILEFEADFDARAPELPVRAMCQYDLARFDPESVSKALWTHEHIVYRGRICENPFYVPPSEFRASKSDQSEAELLLEQTYSLAQARREVGRRRQRIEVLNRTLRHNIRNEINVVLGYLGDVLHRPEEALSESDRQRIKTARRYAENISRTSEKARYVEQTLSGDELEPFDLGRVVDEVTDELSERYPDAGITTAVDEPWTVIADEDLPRAVEELIENAVRHQGRTPPSVSVSVRRRGDAVAIDVVNPGEPIPEDDQRALRRGRETSLLHGRGIGLWMVKWITENSNGSLAFPQGEDECRVRIELPASSVV
ncbi:MEDS domain-containing protein [Halobellus rubicundus]|uniref:histidine kinase n=1 Tax=Halobellus rubicundus TaxID=2996466 RepID=A0ABD5MEM2_9EURY